MKKIITLLLLLTALSCTDVQVEPAVIISHDCPDSYQGITMRYGGHVQTSDPTVWNYRFFAPTGCDIPLLYWADALNAFTVLELTDQRQLAIGNASFRLSHKVSWLVQNELPIDRDYQYWYYEQQVDTFRSEHLDTSLCDAPFIFDDLTIVPDSFYQSGLGFFSDIEPPIKLYLKIR